MRHQSSLLCRGSLRGSVDENGQQGCASLTCSIFPVPQPLNSQQSSTNKANTIDLSPPPRLLVLMEGFLAWAESAEQSNCRHKSNERPRSRASARFVLFSCTSVVSLAVGNKSQPQTFWKSSLYLSQHVLILSFVKRASVHEKN